MTTLRHIVVTMRRGFLLFWGASMSGYFGRHKDEYKKWLHKKMLFAAKTGDTGTMRILSWMGVKAEAHESEALREAAKAQKTQAAILAMDLGAKPLAYHGLPFIMAAKNGDDLLLDAITARVPEIPDPVVNKALETAAEYGQVSTTKKIIADFKITNVALLTTLRDKADISRQVGSDDVATYLTDKIQELTRIQKRQNQTSGTSALTLPPGKAPEFNPACCPA